MSIAENKKLENVAEYIIYVWQMQDLLRSVKLQHEELFTKLGLTDTSDPDGVERKWLKNLARSMRGQKLQEKGHVTEVQTVLAELFFLHNTLINIIKDQEYISLFQNMEPHLKGLIDKSEGQKNIIEHTLVALYGWLILRMQKTSISPETEKAMTLFSKLMAYLSIKFKEMKAGNFAGNLN